MDFDSLWDLAYAPALDQFGYSPVRADSEAGSVIIKDMLERLAPCWERATARATAIASQGSG
ncbi:MAG: hypothetical protein VKO65_00195 [Cyanobacteriota bacterium]|nr:hypothetical protein [Cyanobacteriota bacterium]